MIDMSTSGTSNELVGTKIASISEDEKIELLIKYKELLDNEVITESEFTAKKTLLLDSREGQSMTNTCFDDEMTNIVLLKKYKKVFDDEIINDREFAAKKAKLLNIEFVYQPKETKEIGTIKENDINRDKDIDADDTTGRTGERTDETNALIVNNNTQVKNSDIYNIIKNTVELNSTREMAAYLEATGNDGIPADLISKLKYMSNQEKIYGPMHMAGVIAIKKYFPDYSLDDENESENAIESDFDKEKLKTVENNSESKQNTDTYEIKKVVKYTAGNNLICPYCGKQQKSDRYKCYNCGKDFIKD